MSTPLSPTRRSTASSRWWVGRTRSPSFPIWTPTWRGRVRHRTVERDPAEPPPGERIAHFSAQRLVPQPVPELQEHQPQIDLHRRGRPADPRIEELLERTDKRLIVEQLVHPGQFPG